MTWFEDDSRKISDEMLKMPREERLKIIAEYEEQMKKERAIRLKAKPASA
jgi:hypothetical protein